MAEIQFKNRFLTLYATPKCGITSLQRTIHLNQELLDNLTEPVGTCIVVRNPWARIASFYAEKIVQKQTWRIKRHLFQQPKKETLFQKFLIKLSILCQLEKDISKVTFLEFVRMVLWINDDVIERHLKSQNYNVEDVRFDKILKLEHINVDIKQIHPKLEFAHANDSAKPITVVDGRWGGVHRPLF